MQDMVYYWYTGTGFCILSQIAKSHLFDKGTEQIPTKKSFETIQVWVKTFPFLFFLLNCPDFEKAKFTVLRI